MQVAHRTGKDIEFTDTALKHARVLRGEMTEPEKKLWYHLRRKNIAHTKFRKQMPIGSYIVDFASLNPRLIIEVDGGQHAEQQAYDTKRDQWLRSEGFEILRLWNNDVLQNIEGVLQVITSKLEELNQTSLPPQGGRQEN